MKNTFTSRREFLKKSAIASGAATLGSFSISDSFSKPADNSKKLLREISVATFSQMNMQAKDARAMVDNILLVLKEQMQQHQPDILCLPEVFPFSSIENSDISWDEKITISNETLDRFSRFARDNNSYIICPVYTRENGKIFISAVVFDRNGSRMGEYRKIYVTAGEIESGITPGPVDPPVFETDFGKIGVQICFDVMWNDSWKILREKGAEIVFFPSAFAAGKMVDAKAFQNMYMIVSSTQKDTAKIVDITGEVTNQTGRWSPNFICSPVNLEKVFLHTWPNFQKFGSIKKQYGKKIKITNFHEEEWSIIEILSHDISIADILKEYNLKSKKDFLLESEEIQNKARQA